MLGVLMMQTCRTVHPAPRPLPQVKKISGEELELEIQDRDRPLIVDFFATYERGLRASAVSGNCMA